MSMISMRTYEVSLRAVTFRYLWCVIRSYSPRISGVWRKSELRRTFAWPGHYRHAICKHYMKWSICTGVWQQQILNYSLTMPQMGSWRTQIWYLVNDEDDRNLLCQLYTKFDPSSMMPDDEVQMGDIVSGMWPPKCWQCCDAKLVQI